MKYVLLLFVLIFTLSCKNENQLENDIANINLDIKVERFDKLVAEASLNDFSKLHQAYPFMFSKNDTDSTWIETKSDTLQLQIFSEVNKVFPNFDETEGEMESLFNHIKYYFPEFNSPRVITTTSYVDYKNKVIVTDTIAIVAIDTYLGNNHKFYGGIQKFIRDNLKKEQIVVDMAGEYARKYIYQKQNKTLLDEMVYYGKQLYFKDVTIPFKSEAERIGYSQEQLDWALANESLIWRYFVERELLFSTDSKLPSRFINPGPFSKFYLEGIDSESPARLGRYIGWQIVRTYMKNNDVSLKDLLTMPTEEVFNKSKFKPRRNND